MNQEKTIETEQQYRKALSRHDWWYSYSDDHSVWSKGRENMDRIMGAVKTVDPCFHIWNEYAPDEWKVKPDMNINQSANDMETKQ